MTYLLIGVLFANCRCMFPYYDNINFRSRNVFLRITDKKKYCYYSMYSWSCTVILGVLAIFAHFTMDYPELNRSIKFLEDREEIGKIS